MQAIETKYLGPTNFRGARIKASAEVGSITISWDHALNVEENHDVAARALITKWGWHGSWVRGAAPSNKGNVYVCVRRECAAGYRTPHPQAVNAYDLLIVRES